jgi:hypothetical protein
MTKVVRSMLCASVCLAMTGCNLDPFNLEGAAKQLGVTLDRRIKELIVEIRKAVPESEEWRKEVDSLRQSVNVVPERAILASGEELRVTLDHFIRRIEQENMGDILKITSLLKANKRMEALRVFMGAKTGFEEKHKPTIYRSAPRSVEIEWIDYKTSRLRNNVQTIVLTGADLVQPSNRYKVETRDKEGRSLRDITSHFLVATPYQIQFNVSAGNGIQFNYPDESQVIILHGDQRISALTVAWDQRPPKPEPIVKRLGPSKGDSAVFVESHDFSDSQPPDAKIARIIVRSVGNEVNGLKVIYELDGKELPDSSQMHGGAKGSDREFVINDDEYLTGITGKTGTGLDFIRFHTNKGRSEGFGGGGGSDEFSFFCEDENGNKFEIVGFYGRTRDVIVTKIGPIVRSR